MDFKEYAKIPALSASILKELKRSVAHGVEASKYDGEATEALIMGNAFHSYLLELDKFKSEYGSLSRKLDKRKKSHKRLDAYAVKKYGDKLLSPDQYQKITNWKQSVLANKSALSILKTITKVEHTITWDDRGVACKARLDAYSPQLKAIIDIKTTVNASKQAFSSQIYNLGYYLQASHYIDGAVANDLDVDKFIFIAVEKDAPYCTAVYSLNLEALNAGAIEREDLVAKWRDYQETKEITGYSDQVEDISLPNWALTKIEGKDE